MVTNVAIPGVDYDRIRQRVEQADRLLAECAEELQRVPEFVNSAKVFLRARTTAGGGLTILKSRLFRLARRRVARGGR